MEPCFAPCGGSTQVAGYDGVLILVRVWDEFDVDICMKIKNLFQKNDPRSRMRSFILM